MITLRIAPDDPRVEVREFPTLAMLLVAVATHDTWLVATDGSKITACRTYHFPGHPAKSALQTYEFAAEVLKDGTLLTATDLANKGFRRRHKREDPTITLEQLMREGLDRRD